MKYPPAVEEITQFENYLLLLIKNLKFKKVHNDFQMRLPHDIKEIKAKKDEYNKLLQDNISKTYKKSSAKKLRDINFEARNIAEKLSVAG